MAVSVIDAKRQIDVAAYYRAQNDGFKQPPGYYWQLEKPAIRLLFAKDHYRRGCVVVFFSSDREEFVYDVVSELGGQRLPEWAPDVLCGLLEEQRRDSAGCYLVRLSPAAQQSEAERHRVKVLLWLLQETDTGYLSLHPCVDELDQPEKFNSINRSAKPRDVAALIQVHLTGSDVLPEKHS